MQEINCTQEQNPNWNLEFSEILKMLLIGPMKLYLQEAPWQLIGCFMYRFFLKE